MGIDYLQRNVNNLVKDYNEYCEGQDEEKIAPQILGVVFTMIQLAANGPIGAQKNFIAQTKKNIPTFETFIVANNTIFANAPETGIPVVLTKYSDPAHKKNVDRLKEFTKEFMNKAGLQ
jgi:chromosome partitioning protein